MMYREEKHADIKDKGERQRTYRTECSMLAVTRGLDVGRFISPLWWAAWTQLRIRVYLTALGSEG